MRWMSPAISSARSTTPTQLSPKSVALMCPLAEMSRLSGFTSRWMMPCGVHVVAVPALSSLQCFCNPSQAHAE